MSPLARRRAIFAAVRAAALGPKVQIGQGRDRLWYWHLKAGNGEIISQGEGYVTRTGARAGAERVRLAFGRILPGSF